MEIRPATADDFEGIRRVARRAWEQTYDDVFDTETIESTVDDWYSDLSLGNAVERPGTALLVAQDGDEIIGFAHAVVNGDTGDVVRMYVHPDRWREGFGTALFERLRGDLRDFNIKRLEGIVVAGNDVGAEFYEDLGFERTGEGQVTIGDQTYTEHVYALDL